MSTAEDRLREFASGVYMVDPGTIAIADLAREAIALLRKVQAAGYEHPIKCETGCQCEWYDLGEELDKFLDGGDE